MHRAVGWLSDAVLRTQVYRLGGAQRLLTVNELDPKGRVLVDEETSEILGASILGVEGDEAIHSILDVMYARQPYTVIQRAVHIHPTVSELIPTLLGGLKRLSSERPATG